MEVPKQLEEKADEYIRHYPDDQKRSASLPLLHLLQAEFGHVGEEAVGWVADQARPWSRSTCSSW